MHLPKCQPCLFVCLSERSFRSGIGIVNQWSLTIVDPNRTSVTHGPSDDTMPFCLLSMALLVSAVLLVFGSTVSFGSIFGFQSPFGIAFTAVIL